MIELHPTDIAHGGEAVARVDGKVHFVDGAMPGETVLGEVVRSTASWARVELSQVVVASPDRVEPRCRHFGVCGGCRWQFADYAAQTEWKRSILAGQLSHLGRLPEPPVRPTESVGPPYGYRTRADFEVSGGRAAFHRRRSRDLEPITECHVLHPLVRAVTERLDDLGSAVELTIRAATASGEVLAVVRGAVPEGAGSWGCDVAQRNGDRIRQVIGKSTITETVAGAMFRITGDTFFQNNTAGAEVLVRLVGEALRPERDETLLDAYAGGGLFGATVGAHAGRVLAIESSGLAVGDLRHNLALAGIDHVIIPAAVEKAQLVAGTHWDVAVVDPPRAGLGERGVEVITSGAPRAIAYVSCDPASLARDSRHLAEAGYRMEWATPVDMFPQTFHIETVAAFAAD